VFIAVTGPAGSGKTTLASLISRELEIPLVSTGTIFRQMAEERGMDVLSFNLYAEGKHEVDLELDAAVVEKAREMRNCVVEGRLACAMLRRAGLTVFCIYLDAPPAVRAGRIERREGGNYKEVMERMIEREESERRRFLSIYGVDVKDTSQYELVLDSSTLGPEEICRIAVEHVRRWRDGHSPA